MRILLSLLVLILLLYGGNAFAEDALDEALDIDLDVLGVGDDAEERLLRGNFYYSYLTGDYDRSLHYLHQWENLTGSDDAPESEAEVMLAAVYLSLGLLDQAETLFYGVFSKDSVAPGKAWYFLAKRLFVAGYYVRSEKAARNALAVVKDLSSSFRGELQYLLVSSICQQGRIEDARHALLDMPDGSIWTGYAQYNLLLAMQQQNYRSRDIELLVDEAIYFLPDSEEGTALRDRILLISGIAAMERDKLVLANRYFSNITLESAFTPPALLHHGWNLLAQRRYEDAMQPWRILQQLYDDYHPAVIESYLAVPHALELVNAVNQSVIAYAAVEEQLSLMVDELKSLNHDEGLVSWLAEWRQFNQAENWGWQRQSLSDLPFGQMSQLLQGLIQEETFNQELVRLHDIDRIRTDLSTALDHLGLWEGVIGQRRDYLSSIEGEALLANLKTRQLSLLRDIIAIQRRLFEEDQSVFSYASKKEEERITKLRNVVSSVNSLREIGTPTRDLDVYKERWRRMRGLQLWSVYDNAPQRKWDTERDYMVLRAETDNLFQQLERTQTSLIWADNFWQGFPTRLQQMKERVINLDMNLADLQKQQEARLISMARDHLTKLDKRLTLYLAQARLSLARLNDDSLQRRYDTESVAGSLQAETVVGKVSPHRTHLGAGDGTR